MTDIPDPQQALDRLETRILPGIAITLEALLDAARLPGAGAGHAASAAELRAIADQLSEVVRQLEATTRSTQAAPEWPFRMSA